MASFSEEIVKLTDPTPQIFDPEDDIITETAAKVTSTFDENDGIEYDFSDLRSKTAPLLEDVDERYTGRKSSRKSFESSFLEAPDIGFNDVSKNSSRLLESDDDSTETNEDDGSEVEDDEEDERLDAFKNQLINKIPGSDDAGDSENEDDSDKEEEGSSDDEDEESDVEGEKLDEFHMVHQFSNIDVDSEIEKGKAIKSQQELWNKLCEIRIRLQKILMVSNKLPQHESWEYFKENGGNEYSSNLKKSYNGMKSIVNCLLDLQTSLLSRNPETKNLEDGASKIKSTSVSDEEIPSDSDEDMEEDDNKELETCRKKSRKRKLDDDEFEDFMQKRHSSIIPYRNSVIEKWDGKTRLSSGKMSQKSFLSFENTALKQIEQVLQDKHRLIKRTQLKRSLYHIIGKPDVPDGIEEEQESKSKHDILLKDYDPEIFDDDDFYRQLLKDIIESKSIGIDSALLKKQIEIQKIRSKMKRKIDTKASKGRKLRYDIHPKMVNYMAPVYENLMSDEARDNLFKSLYGQVNTL